jgi:glucose-6-phosphate dehydrogenase assembly protein OpcA
MPEVPLREVATLEEIERRIGELWDEVASREHAVLRACKMNLVVVCRRGEDLPALLEDLGRVTDVNPGRVVVISAAPEDAGGPPRLVPWIAAHCHPGPGGHPVCSEQVVLESRGPAEALLPEAVLRLIVGDMPVFVWWRAPLVGEPLLEPLLRTADRFIANTAEEAEAARALGALASLSERPAWHGNVGDLAWVRTDPWREIVASMFDAAGSRERLDRIARVRVASKGPDHGPGSTGVYLAGWLASRLGWRIEGRGRARRADGATIDVVLETCPSAVRGRVAAVSLESEDGTVLEARRTRADGTGVRITAGAAEPIHPRLLRVEALDDLALLLGELQRDGRDPVFEAALLAASALME